MQTIKHPSVCGNIPKQPQNLNINQIRADFPILQEMAHNHPLVYFDNAATTQKPLCVIEAINHFYRAENANIHRGIHLFSERATKSFEAVREKIKTFINAKESSEIIFVRGTTEAINLIAQSYARPNLKPGDEIIITAMEHHSNIVPWQLVCQQTGASLKIIPISETGELILDNYGALLTPRTKLLAVTHISNALGTINPVHEMIELAHQQGIPVLLDGAQAIAHLPIDVQQLNCDFYVFSGHKVYGPTGIGILYGKAELLRAMPPYHGGGDMISQVTFEKTIYKDIPYKFEAGTPPIAEVIGLGSAIDYLNNIGLVQIAAYENELLEYATKAMKEIPGIRIIGNAQHKASIISFTMDNIHPHDIGTILDHQGIAIRAGHHCAMPIMDFFNIPATARASFSLYNTKDEIDIFVEGLKKTKEIFE
ncbi:MAG: Cysteine desulfurase SufS [Legionellaceae bacterium]